MYCIFISLKKAIQIYTQSFLSLPSPLLLHHTWHFHVSPHSLPSSIILFLFPSFSPTRNMRCASLHHSNTKKSPCKSLIYNWNKSSPWSQTIGQRVRAQSHTKLICYSCSFWKSWKPVGGSRRPVSCEWTPMGPFISAKVKISPPQCYSLSTYSPIPLLVMQSHWAPTREKDSLLNTTLNLNFFEDQIELWYRSSKEMVLKQDWKLMWYCLLKTTIFLFLVNSFVPPVEFSSNNSTNKPWIHYIYLLVNTYSFYQFVNLNHICSIEYIKS